MCQIIDSEMLVDYVLAKHEVVTAAQLESIRKRILSDIADIILIDVTLRGLQELHERLPNRFQIERGSSGFSIRRTKDVVPYTEEMLDGCYAAAFPRNYEKIKEILFATWIS